MTLVLDRNWAGTSGSSYANADDADFDIVAGTAPTYQDSAHLGVKCLRFPVAAQGIIGETTFTGSTVRTISRIWRLSALPAQNGEVVQVRSSGGRGPGILITTAGKLIMANVNGSSVKTSTGTIPVGTEFRIRFTVNGTALTIEWFADTTSTTPVETMTGTSSGAVTMVTVRDGHLTVGGLGAGSYLEVSWPRDESTTTDPGPRTYPKTASGGSALTPTAPTLAGGGRKLSRGGTGLASSTPTTTGGGRKVGGGGSALAASDSTSGAGSKVGAGGSQLAPVSPMLFALGHKLTRGASQIDAEPTLFSGGRKVGQGGSSIETSDPATQGGGGRAARGGSVISAAGLVSGGTGAKKGVGGSVLVAVVQTEGGGYNASASSSLVVESVRFAPPELRGRARFAPPELRGDASWKP